MKYLGSFLLRAIFAIVIGLLLIRNPESIPTGLTMLAGFLFLISGIISCSSYIGILKFGGMTAADGSRRKPFFPIVGIGCLIFGGFLVFAPEFFVRFLMYIFGGVLVLGAINEFVVLSRLFRMEKISVFFWILPSLIFITGLIVLFKPMKTAELPFIISGWCLLLYGLSELIQIIKLYITERNMKKLAEEGAATQEFSDVENFNCECGGSCDCDEEKKDE